MQPVFTIGHSNHPIENFLNLLGKAEITAVADVRSAPFSRWAHFNRDSLRTTLAGVGIEYVFLGKELGGRPANAAFLTRGVADYELMAQSQSFSDGIDRVLSGAKKYRVALMCSELEPLDCHRCLLVGRRLANLGCKVVHILGDGKCETHTDCEQRLLKLEGRERSDFFSSYEDRLSLVYRQRARKVAYSPHEATGS